MSKALGFTYYGGKVRLAKWIISNFPKHKTYIEPFGGGAAVLLNKPPVSDEYYNDLDKLVVNFFHVMRERFEEFYQKVQWLEKSEYVREWTTQAINRDWSPPDVDAALAWWWCVTCLIGAGSYDNRGSIVADHPAPMKPSRLKLIQFIRDRFADVVIMNRDALEILTLKFVDKEDILIYLDPPYIGNQESYKHKFSLKDHERLLEILASLKHAKFALSGFESDLYLQFAKEQGWYIVTKERLLSYKGGAAEYSYGVKRPTVKELLILNYEPPKTTLSLFDHV